MTIERKANAVGGMTGSGSTDAMGAIRRPNDILSPRTVGRIKQILRGTFLENPEAGSRPSGSS